MRGQRIPLPFRGQKTPDGTARCGLCGEAVPKGRRSWCGDGCVDRFMIQHQSFARSRVFARDAGVCASCGWDCKEPMIGPMAPPYRSLRGLGIKHEVRDLRANQWFRPWDADHIVPIVEGGPHAIENLRTLCRPCHLAETRALRGRMAEARALLGEVKP